MMEERFGIKIELPEPFLQKDLEEYQNHLMVLTKGDVSAAVFNGAILKAGILAGFVKGCAVDEVPGIKSYVVRWASRVLHGMVDTANRIPPE